MSVGEREQEAFAPGQSFSLYRGLDRETIATIRDLADALYRDIEAGARSAPFVSTSSSVLLEALDADAGTGLVERTFHRPGIESLLRTHLGDRIVCGLDQNWLRRQYAPSRYPPGHAPHSWHQDGALGFDFAALGNAEPPADALLNMITCWIALTPCGDDAPGLELIRRNADRLYHPGQLTDDHLRNFFPAEAFVAPVMEPGDVLILTAGCLHRTHVTPAMQHDRTSVELRFLAAGRIPERLRGERFQALSAKDTVTTLTLGVSSNPA